MSQKANLINYKENITGNNMNDYWYCIASKIIGITGFVTLVIFGHPWFGAACLLFIAINPEDNK